MEQNGSDSSSGYEPRPPPYSPKDYGQSPYTVMQHQPAQQGGIAVVSYPSSYHNAGGPEEAAAASLEAPPEYSEGAELNGFSDAAIRRGFIRKVYLTLMVQLLVTVGIICAFIYWETLRRWTWENYWFNYCMIAVVFVLIIALSCCDNLRRQVPLNFIALGVFTLAEGAMLGSVAAFYETEAVLWAMGATAVVAFSLTLFAMQTKWDFTTASGSLWVFCWTLFSFGLLCAILRSQYLYIFYACLGTLLFSLYMVFDTQIILGGKHRKYQISPEEYVFAALSLYLDIITLFLLLLQLIGLCR